MSESRPLEITVISGKGGTGKTSISGSFAVLARNAVVADCDVDAANLSLILKARTLRSEAFSGSKSPVPDLAKCIGCGVCVEHCRSKALKCHEDKVRVDLLACERCQLCHRVCSLGAMGLEDSRSGEWYVSDTSYGTLVHARLEPGEENSGKLVTVVRNEARRLAEAQSAEWVIIDGPPGIGCPVISSLAGTKFALVVTEPTLSAISDMQRVLDVARIFGVSAGVCINKCDLHKQNAHKIYDSCRELNIPVLAKIPFNPVFTAAMVNGLPVVEYEKGDVSQVIRDLWQKVKQAARDAVR